MDRPWEPAGQANNQAEQMTARVHSNLCWSAAGGDIILCIGSKVVAAAAPWLAAEQLAERSPSLLGACCAPHSTTCCQQLLLYVCTNTAWSTQATEGQPQGSLSVSPSYVIFFHIVPHLLAYGPFPCSLLAAWCCCFCGRLHCCFANHCIPSLCHAAQITLLISQGSNSW